MAGPEPLEWVRPKREEDRGGALAETWVRAKWAPQALWERMLAMAYFGAFDALGPGARCLGRPDINNAGHLQAGERFRIRNSFVPTEITCHAGGRIDIGARVTINYGVILSARKNIVIGNDVLIGNFSIICDSKFPLSPGQAPLEGDEPEAIEIGDEVWLAARVTLLPGAKIGRGAVIAAGAVVSGSIPAGVVAMGAPARPVIPAWPSPAGTTPARRRGR